MKRLTNNIKLGFQDSSKLASYPGLWDRLKKYEDTDLEPEDMHKAKPLDEWYEEDGDCLWWSFPIEEPPYCGTPLDCDFPDHVTHFTKFVIPQN
ncbi:hypothetical protein [Lacrimispora sp.]|uniref:hypothetical protein n=1 Tax=Lacrimispora sp. TaxID=2719234 RepID=UPI0028AF995F|nr:hypothetical protein [Lacrimispora sp.]